MEKFNLDAAIQRTLFLLEKSGASKKLLKEYRCTGLGRIKRHFCRRSIYQKKYDEIISRYDAVKAKYDNITAEIQKRKTKRERNFIKRI